MNQTNEQTPRQAAECKNAILKGVNYDEAATGQERNTQIGGHRGGKNEY